MNPESLSDPVTDEQPAGADCQAEIYSQHLALMTEYLVERALQKGRENATVRPGIDDGTKRNAAELRDAGKRRLIQSEGILKEAIGVAAVNAELVAKVLWDKTTSLLSRRGKDLRVLPHLCAAGIVMQGLAGYAAALDLVSVLLRVYRDGLFPLPDEDDTADDSARVNVVSELLSGDGIRALLGAVVVIDGKQSGRVTLDELVGGLRDDMPVAEISVPKLESALKEAGADGIRQLSEDVLKIEAAIFGLAVDLGTSMPATRMIETFKRVALRVGAPPGANAVTAEHVVAGTQEQVLAVGNGSGGAATALRSREDARRVLRDLIPFIEMLAPGHPAPLLLKRADRLLGMSFFDIIKDMAPNAVPDIERIVGTAPAD